jgi:HTH-type transcriptional regulator / antitoxin MqsA
MKTVKSGEAKDGFMKAETFYQDCVCPVCEVGTLTLIEKDLDFTYKGETMVLRRSVWECSDCQESFLQNNDERDVEKILTDRQRRVDGLLVSEEIQTIREKLHLTTAGFATLLRISEQDLMNYESGQDVQRYELDDVLRILQAYPEAIAVFQPTQPVQRRRMKQKLIHASAGQKSKKALQPSDKVI